MSETLERLREAFSGDGAAPVLSDDGQYLCFPGQGVKYRADSETAYKSRRGAGPYYTLVTVWFQMLHAGDKYSDYTALAKEKKIPVVSVLDGKPLVAYLKGEKDAPDAVKPDGVAAPPVAEPYEAAAGGEAAGEGASGRARDEAGDGDAPKAKRAKRAAGDAKATLIKQTMTRVAPFDSKTIAAFDREAAGEDAGVSAVIMGKERPARTMVSSLMVHERTFDTVVFKLVNDIKRKAAEEKAAGKSAPAIKVRRDRYNVNPDQAWKEQEGNDALEAFGIDTMGTFASRDAAAGEADKADKKAAKKPASADDMRREAAAAIARKHDATGMPIIIVPTAPSSLITQFNVSSFLDGKFMTTAEAKQAGAKRQTKRIYTRKKGGKEIKYQIVDAPTKMPTEDWQRVVAVFAFGPSWQFKGWPFSGPVDIFQHMVGVHMHWSDALKIDPNMLEWNVKVMPLHRRRRHQDASLVRDIWNDIDQFVAMHKPRLTNG